MGWKVLALNADSDVLITADNVVVTADTLSVTADGATIAQAGVVNIYSIRITPRFFTENVKLFLKDELTSKKSEQTVVATEDNGYMNIIFEKEFREGDTYEIKVKSLADELIWVGRVFITAQTDLENYSDSQPNASGVIKL